ncbi:MAG TPA: DUF5916 domain-containing protein [Vicinamibacterales bacterium]|nr:DUF5916 domain-containing protein [Vicinamibacterales bacterium]
MVRVPVRAAICAVFLLAASPASPQPPAIDGPPAPVSPEVVSRDAAGRATVRAIRLTTPLTFDGRLDDDVYRSTQSISGFVQQVPREGTPATEKTEAWVLFDADTLYVSARCWDSAPPSRWVANELRRDTNQLRQNDTFGVILDTFYDRRNGFLFYTNPLGARADQAVTDEGNLNPDWNPVWDVRTGRFDGGWTVEMAIPFKSLRYTSGSDQVWGINIRRVIRRKNEWTHLTLVPAAAGVPGGMFRLSRAGTLVGLDLPAASRNVELKPYGISKVTSDRVVTPAIDNDLAGDGGLDAKYGVTANLTADLTVNTDFAQVEVDEQQVNLTRFSILYPEKRDFFLEGRGLFDFARSGPMSTNNVLTPQLFYSRRIGLNAGRVIPIDVGGRLTGKVGRYGIGAMNIETRDEDVSKTPRTNFSVVRVKRDILRRSTIGAMVTNRSQSTVSRGSANLVYGADAAFSFFQNLNLGGYWARSDTGGNTTDNDSYQGRFDYTGDRYGLTTHYLKVGDNFNPEVGFVRRDNLRRTFGQARFSPRPRVHFKGIRQFTYLASVEYIENGAGQLESRLQTARFALERQNSDTFSVEATSDYELLLRPFTVSRGVVIVPGGYAFSDVTLAYQMGLQRRVSGTWTLQRGAFYDGTITAASYTGARVSLLKQWSVEPSVSVNDVSLPAGDFTTTLLRARSDYGFSPRMFASALLQYSSTDRLFSSNLRFRWEYLPGSELFVVYTDERDTLKPGYPDLRNRAFVVKINRLFRF